MAGRPRSVLTPKPERAKKPKPSAPERERSIFPSTRTTPPLTVADLAAKGLARQHADGKWEISPEGQRLLHEDQVRP